MNTAFAIQPYKFGGKDFQHTHGLDLYDYHARQYDAATGHYNVEFDRNIKSGERHQSVIEKNDPNALNEFNLF